MQTQIVVERKSRFLFQDNLNSVRARKLMVEQRRWRQGGTSDLGRTSHIESFDEWLTKPVQCEVFHYAVPGWVWRTVMGVVLAECVFLVFKAVLWSSHR